MKALKGYEDSDFEDYPKATWKDNLITVIEIFFLLTVGFAVSVIIVSAGTYYVNWVME